VSIADVFIADVSISAVSIAVIRCIMYIAAVIRNYAYYFVPKSGN